MFLLSFSSLFPIIRCNQESCRERWGVCLGEGVVQEEVIWQNSHEMLVKDEKDKEILFFGTGGFSA